jgi:hypothetical protein
MATTKKKLENFTDLVVGDTVAYNRSGDVLIGVVEKIEAVQILWYNRPSHINVNASIKNCKTGVVSKVKNLASIAKIHPDSVNL